MGQVCCRKGGVQRSPGPRAGAGNVWRGEVGKCEHSQSSSFGVKRSWSQMSPELLRCRRANSPSSHSPPPARSES